MCISEHDERSVGTDNSRRIPFKHKRFGNKGHQKDWSNSIRAHLEDEDVDMSGTSFGYQKKHYHNNNNRRGGGRPGSPAPNKIGMKRKLLASPTNWYRITVSFLCCK